MLCVEKSLKNDNVHYDPIFELLDVVRYASYEPALVLTLKQKSSSIGEAFISLTTRST